MVIKSYIIISWQWSLPSATFSFSCAAYDPTDHGSIPRHCCLLLFPWARNFICIALVDPAVLIGECEATPVVVFPWARNITHIAPAYPAVMGTWRRCHLLGKGKAGPAWKPTYFVDVAIQGKSNNLYLYLLHSYSYIIWQKLYTQ